MERVAQGTWESNHGSVSYVFAPWASQLECVPVKRVLQRYAEGEVSKENQLAEQLGKGFAKTLNNQARTATEDQVMEEKAGFRRGKGCE